MVTIRCQKLSGGGTQSATWFDVPLVMGPPWSTLRPWHLETDNYDRESVEAGPQPGIVEPGLSTEN